MKVSENRINITIFKIFLRFLKYIPQDVISISAYDATIVWQKERHALTCFNEKVQIKNVKMETFSIRPCDQHKSNNFKMAVLNSSHKIHGFCIEGKAKNEVLVAK